MGDSPGIEKKAHCLMCLGLIAMALFMRGPSPHISFNITGLLICPRSLIGLSSARASIEMEKLPSLGGFQFFSRLYCLFFYSLVAGHSPNHRDILPRSDEATKLDTSWAASGGRLARMKARRMQNTRISATSLSLKKPQPKLKHTGKCCSVLEVENCTPAVVCNW